MQPGLLERVGIRALTRRAPRVPEAGTERATNPVHLLDADERAALRRIERSGVVRSACAGALSAVVAAAAEMLVVDQQETRPLFYWGVLATVSIIAAIVEIWFVSWDALRTVHAMSAAAGVYGDERLPRAVILTALARAALEVPNPYTSTLGVDPLRESRRALLVIGALVYKLKISATNALLKLVVRRALGRAAVRSWLPLLAVPVTALWNAAVTALVLREARLRIFGPSLALDVVERVLAPDGGPPSPRAAEGMLRAVASCIVRSADLHPNLELLLATLVSKLAAAMPADVSSSRAFLALLPELDDVERLLVLRALRAAAVIDGRIARRERALLQEAGAWSDEVDAERRRVLAGEPLLLT